MTGEDLFYLFAEAMEAEGVSVDRWEDAEETEQAAWNAVGAQVELKR